MKLNVKGHTGMYRDSVSKAIIVEDTGADSGIQTQKKCINTIISDVNYLKSEMLEIKQLLKDIKDGS
jgi:hypothetical protein